MRRRHVLTLAMTVPLLGMAALGSTVRPPQAPGRLSQTGLYAADGTIDPRNEPFVPQYPLWTDGAAKSRWIRLPQGTRIDVSDVNAWRFPVGTRIWKEFAWDGRKVETRMLWQTGEDDWVFATYVWNDAQTDAFLAPAEGVRDVVEVAAGKRHSVPGTTDCLSCHRSGPSVVLGFSALQLSDDRDPLAPHAEPLVDGALTLGSLVATDRLDPPRPELARTPPRIRARDPYARAALGYLSANCGACHNGTGPLARLGLELLHDAAADPFAAERAVATALDVPGRWAMPGLAEGASRRVAPGAPERSALLHRMLSRRPSSQMPPLGTVLVDEEAARIVRRWIEGAGNGTAPAAAPAALP